MQVRDKPIVLWLAKKGANAFKLGWCKPAAAREEGGRDRCIATATARPWCWHRPGPAAPSFALAPVKCSKQQVLQIELPTLGWPSLSLTFPVEGRETALGTGQTWQVMTRGWWPFALAGWRGESTEQSCVRVGYSHLPQQTAEHRLVAKTIC